MEQDKLRNSSNTRDGSLLSSRGEELGNVSQSVEVKQIYCKIPSFEDDTNTAGSSKTKNADSPNDNKVINTIQKCLNDINNCKVEKYDSAECKWYLEIYKSDCNNSYKTGYYIVILLSEINELNGDATEFNHEVCFFLYYSTNNELRKSNEEFSKKCFEEVTLRVEKDLIKLEFPVLPEGDSSKPFKSYYQLNKELSSGSFGTVFLSTHRATGRILAVKAVNRTKFTTSQELNIYREVVHLASVDAHPSIIKFIDFFEECEWYMIVMEFCEGGSLFNKCGYKDAYSENDVREVVRELLGGVKYCHDNNVAHLDLNSKNLLLKAADIDSGLKICDFGFSERVAKPKCLTKQKGTPFFVAVRKYFYLF